MLKKFFSLLILIFVASTLIAQVQYVRYQVGVSYISPNKASGYTISGTYQGEFLGIFRPGFGIQAMNMMSDTLGLLSHHSALDANLSWGVAIKFKVRLQGGIGLFGRLWQRSFAADNSGPQLYVIDGVNYTLSPGEFITYNYLTWGMFYYLNLGIDLTNNVSLYVFYQNKRDLQKDITNALGLGLSFRM